MGGHADVWEKVVRKLRTGMMPPDGVPKPGPEVRSAFAAALEASLDRAAAARLDPGTPALHRLNRAEYANAIRDLLALDVDVAALLPPDDSAAGFDNIADVLGVSPALIEGYAAAAAQISRRAIGSPTIGLDRTTYRMPGDVSQAAHVDGLPLGTRGGFVIRHTFPLDAEYDLQVGQAGGARLGGPAAAGPRADDLYVTIDGVRVTLQGGRGATRLKVAAGPRTIAAASVVRSHAAGADGVYHVESRTPGITQVTIAGPFNATGPGDTPSRRKLLVCTPAAAAEELPCARTILAALATRAFRRPIAAASPELDTALEFYREGRAAVSPKPNGEGGFEAGIERAVARILVDPQFLFRFEREPARVAAGTAFRVTDLELASRLSFFLWSSIPDDELLAVAAKGGLKRAGHAGASGAADAGRRERRGAGDELRVAVAVPARAAERAARFAGLRRQPPPIVPARDGAAVPHHPARGPQHRRPAGRRLHLRGRAPGRALRHPRRARLAHAPRAAGRPTARVAACSATAASSPSRRPPTAPRRCSAASGCSRTCSARRRRSRRRAWKPISTATPAAVKAASLRQRMEQHRANPACASCHKIMDPIGFALENFDHAGKWRSADGRTPIDAQGQLVDGTQLDGSDVAAPRAARARRRVRRGRGREAADLRHRPGAAAAGHAVGARDHARRGRGQLSLLVARARRRRTPQFQMRTKAAAGK